MMRVTPLLGSFLVAALVTTTPGPARARVPSTTDEARELAGLRPGAESIPAAVWDCRGRATASDEARAEAGASHVGVDALAPWSSPTPLPASGTPTTTDEARALAAAATDARAFWSADRDAALGVSTLAARDTARSSGRSGDRHRCASWM
jgi:hypothetical protein